jgi:heme/copper-type cytochrome/quinol oxidase subunit 3
VAVGVFMIFCCFLQSLRGTYGANHYASLEYIGLYWHFVDLVWIILFTVVYLI